MELTEAMKALDGHFMTLSEYQHAARLTAIYPDEHSVTYPLLGLVGEVGEFSNKWKKTIRDNRELDLDDAKRELGDILWYLAQTTADLNFDLNAIAWSNLEKLADRQDRGVIGGSGDSR